MFSGNAESGGGRNCACNRARCSKMPSCYQNVAARGVPAKNANGMASAARAISTPTIGANALVEAKM